MKERTWAFPGITASPSTWSTLARTGLPCTSPRPQTCYEQAWKAGELVASAAASGPFRLARPHKASIAPTSSVETVELNASTPVVLGNDHLRGSNVFNHLFQSSSALTSKKPTPQERQHRIRYPRTLHALLRSCKHTRFQHTLVLYSGQSQTSNRCRRQASASIGS